MLFIPGNKVGKAELMPIDRLAIRFEFFRVQKEKTSTVLRLDAHESWKKLFMLFELCLWESNYILYNWMAFVELTLENIIQQIRLLF